MTWFGWVSVAIYAAMFGIAVKDEAPYSSLVVVGGLLVGTLAVGTGTGL